MITYKRCSDELADFTLVELQIEYKKTKIRYYGCYVLGIACVVSTLFLLSTSVPLFGLAIVPLIFAINGEMRGYWCEASILKAAINYRLSTK